MAFIAPKPEGACARGLRSINAIHPSIRVQDWINIQIILKYTTIMHITV